MTVLQIVYAPSPIFRQKAVAVKMVDAAVRKTAEDMLETLYAEHAVGLGANMVGLLQQIVVVDIQENGKKSPLILINPDIFWCSETTQTFEEASLSYPFISAEIRRPDAIKLRYLDIEGQQQEMEVKGFLAAVIQHEVDYLKGKVFLDYLSPMKRDMLLKKMQKQMKANPPHVHSEHCRH